MKVSYLFIFTIFSYCCHAQSSQTAFRTQLVISELFPDPTPTVGLPEKEFVELRNVSKDTINLQGYTLGDTDKEMIFGKYFLPPQEFLIVCKSADSAAFRKFGTLYTFISFITLNNAGDTLYLRSPGRIILDSISYHEKSYTGGYTLECDTAMNYCSNKHIKVSKNVAGGTPGKAPDVLNQEIYPALKIVSIEVKSDSTIQVNFNSSIIPSPQTIWSIDQRPLAMAGNYISSNAAVLNLGFEIIQGKNYEVSVANITSCDGKKTDLLNLSFIDGAMVDSLDLLINEVLFNPSPGGVDFVELYNPSNRVADLKGWTITSIKSNSELQSIFTNSSFLLPPKNYLILTSDVIMLKSKYPQTQDQYVLELNLPSFNDDSGGIKIASPTGKIIDQFFYNENMHLPFLDQVEDVSLERISFSTSTSEIHNWHSASSLAGFATPGFVNSQHLTNIPSEEWLIEPRVFSPDGDGNDDFASIKYATAMAGQMANIAIYDFVGRPIKRLVNQESLSTNGFIKWDGTTDNNSRAPMGNYILFIQLYTLSGQVNEFKKEVTLTLRKD